MKISGSSRKDGMTLYGPRYQVNLSYKDGQYNTELKERANVKGTEKLSKIPGLRGPVKLFQNSGLIALGFGMQLAAELCEDDEKKSAWITLIDTILSAVILWKVAGNVKTLRRFHGAEHKVIGAEEEGISLELDQVKAVSRVSSRCGTNFAGFYIISQLLAQLLPIKSQFIRTMIALGAAYEAFRLEPDQHKWVKPFYDLGGKLQYYVTTAEPQDEELEAAIGAMRILVEAERKVQDESAEQEENQAEEVSAAV